MAVDDKIRQLVACIDEISYRMDANRLKLNTDKTQFIWLGTPHQLSKLACDTVTIRGIPIHVSTEAMCLGVLLDSALTFGSHIHHLSGRCFYHFQQMRIVRMSLTHEAAKTMVQSHRLLQQHSVWCQYRLHTAPTECT